MSDALNYLVKIRPDAMTGYFSFLKLAGTHLDVKTRDLISVITKVAVQTEPGFKQYLTRALRDGCTPNEIIDALLMAFPVLGLAKIVWATDILLSMDLPGFRPENLDAPASWHDIVASADLVSGEVQFFAIEGRHLFVYCNGSEYRVYDSRCPHQVTDIPHLALEGTTLTCPKHHWQFDVASGECTAVGNRPLTVFESKLENGRLLAFW